MSQNYVEGNDHFGTYAVTKLGVDEAGRDAVDTDVLTLALRHHRLDEAEQGRLANRVR